MICALLTSFEIDLSGGEGIRTLDTLSSIHTFQACQFNHSCTPPNNLKIKFCCTRIHTFSRPWSGPVQPLLHSSGKNGCKNNLSRLILKHKNFES